MPTTAASMRHRVTGRVRATLLLAVAALAAGCGEPPGDTLRFGLASAPVTLDPRLATDAASGRINRLLYSRLTDFDDRFEPVPALADWDRLSPTRYRFVLRADAPRFHDGAAVTARDVEATYESVLDPATGSPHRASLSVIERIETIDDRTVDFHLSRPYALFPGLLAVGILPAKLIENGHAFGRDPVGSGPFEMIAWHPSGRLDLRRRADGQRVTFERVADPTVRVLKLLRGEIDMLQGDIPPELVTWLSHRDDVAIARRDGTTFAYLGFNMRDPVVGDVRVRRAIGYAIDREAIITHVLGDAARPAAGLLVPDHWAGDPGLVPMRHDPERARALLRAAGYHEGRPARVVYKTSADPFRLRLATILQAQLAAVGIEVELRSFDWGTFYGDIKAGRFQMYSLAWVGVKLPDIFRYALYSTSVPPAGANRGRYASREVDALIDRAEAAPGLAEQAASYRALQERLADDLPYVPLWHEDQVFVSRARVRGYTVAADGNFDGLLTVTRATAPAP